MDLEEFIGQQPETKNDTPFDSSDMLEMVVRDMKVFELGGKRTSLLEKLYQALDTIPPTSVEAERGFRDDSHWSPL